MPRSPKAKPIEEESPKMTKKEAKGILPFLLSQDDDLAELALAADPRLASLYLIAEKAAKKSLMEFLMLMKGNSEEKKEDELDRAFKMLMLKKLEKEMESSEELKRILLPLLIQNYQESQKQRMLQECLQQKMFQSFMANQPFDYQRALQECQAMAQMSSTMLSSFLPLLSSQSPSQPTSQAQVSQDQVQLEGVDESELETI